MCVERLSKHTTCSDSLSLKISKYDIVLMAVKKMDGWIVHEASERGVGLYTHHCHFNNKYQPISTLLPSSSAQDLITHPKTLSSYSPAGWGPHQSRGAPSLRWYGHLALGPQPRSTPKHDTSSTLAPLHAPDIGPMPRGLPGITWVYRGPPKGEFIFSHAAWKSLFSRTRIGFNERHFCSVGL